jgi:uncharacterized protein (DUF2249 family)
MNTPRPSKARTLDVRSSLARGEQPFARIVASVAELQPGESLLLVTPFLPSPLIEKLQSEGFQTSPELRGDGAWQTAFRRPE